MLAKIVDEITKKWNILALVFLLAAMSSLIITSSSVHASSVYDDSYHSIPNLTIEHDDSCPSMPPTGNYTDYAKYILDEDLWHPGDRNPSSYMYAARESYLAAINDDEYGTWGVSRETNYGGSDIEAINIYWSRNPSSYLQWSTLSVDAYDFSQIFIYCNHYNYWGYQYNSYFGGVLSHAGTVTPVATKQSITRPSQNLFFHSNNPNFNYNYPSGYEGELIVGDTDGDNDGLTRPLELTQGTSDSDADSDGDGLSDLVESRWYSNRDSVFCGAQCAYPNPLVKDVYVEIDWMKNGSNHVIKPTTTQLDLVEDMFANKGINLHIDTGQYGGGEELVTYTSALRRISSVGQVDFSDYKNGGDGISSSFSSNRDLIWRYMIYGNTYYEDTASSGWAETMGDDSFISGGLIENMSGLASQDRAVADTITHEIGHNLCLSRERVWEEQPAECIYGGVDNDDSEDEDYNLEDYESVMNYRYQLTDFDDLGNVDFSDGSHGVDDHNDWGAISLGMKGFAGTRTSFGAKLAVAENTSPDSSVVQEKSIYEIREANERTRAKEALEVSNSQNTHPQEETDASSEVNRQENTSKSATHGTSEILSSNWVLLTVGGVALIAIVASVALWVVRRKK